MATTKRSSSKKSPRKKRSSKKSATKRSASKRRITRVIAATAAGAAAGAAAAVAARAAGISNRGDVSRLVIGFLNSLGFPDVVETTKTDSIATSSARGPWASMLRQLVEARGSDASGFSSSDTTGAKTIKDVVDALWKAIQSAAKSMVRGITEATAAAGGITNRGQVSALVIEFLVSLGFPDTVESTRTSTIATAAGRATWAASLRQIVQTRGSNTGGFSSSDTRDAETVGDIVDALWEAIQDA